MINSLNISHGALGVLVGLKKMNVIIPTEFIDWVKRRDVSVNNYPPGLYVGLSGIAWALSQIEEAEWGLELMDLANSHQHKDVSADIYSGLAGIGLANIHFWNYTGDKKYLEMADKCADQIIRIHKRGAKGTFWVNPDKKTYIGYARGGAGIALFLLYLSIAKNDKSLLEFGKKALEFDLNNIYLSKNIISFPRTTDSTVVSPYWFNGSAGVCTTLLRYYYYTKDIKYKNILSGLLPDISRKYAYNPSLFEGLAGLGNLLLDCYQFLNDESYLKQAKFVASGIEMYKIEKNNGPAFPGNMLFRISNDYATGSIGIGLFYNRLLNNTGNENYLLDWLLN